MKRPYIILCLPVLCCLWSCANDYTPKPTGYFKITFPQKKYQLFNEPGYPYSFEYPTYAHIIKDSTFFDEKAENPWWINIDIPQFDAKIYLSYKIIGGKNNYSKMVNDAFNLTNKHTVKATGIDDSLMHTPNGISGIYFSVGGDVATANQFFVTDTTRHFLRGALYFYATPNADSIAPVNKFLSEDMKHLINTLKWK